LGFLKRARCAHAEKHRISSSKLHGKIQIPITTIRFALIVVGTAAYFSLAVLGWGGPSAFFSHPALIALAVAVFVMAGVSFFAGGNLSAGVRGTVATAGSS
jgi:hypothetical protein